MNVQCPYCGARYVLPQTYITFTCACRALFDRYRDDGVWTDEWEPPRRKKLKSGKRVCVCGMKHR